MRIEAEAREREKSKAEFDAKMEAFTRRHDALRMSMEAAWKEREARRAERDSDSEYIRRLENIAAAHEHQRQQ